MANKPDKKKGQPVSPAVAPPAAKPFNFTPYDARLMPALEALSRQKGTSFHMRSKTWIMNFLLEEGLERHGLKLDDVGPADAGD